VKLSCPPRRAVAVWIESHRIRIVRSDGTSAGPDITLNPSDTASQFAEYPPKFEPMLNIRRKTPFDATAMERRRFPRVELSTPLPARLGRVEGDVVDLSARGARVRHATAVPRGATFRLTFQCGTQECSAMAKVVASRVVSVGREASTLPQFESRLALVEVPHISEYLLARLMVRVSANEAGTRAMNA
jgi:hypothetical protein